MVYHYYTKIKNVIKQFVCSIGWLDSKLQVTEDRYDKIARSDLQIYIITNYFDNKYYDNIDFAQQILKFYINFQTEIQKDNDVYRYIKYRNEDDYTQINIII